MIRLIGLLTLFSLSGCFPFVLEYETGAFSNWVKSLEKEEITPRWKPVTLSEQRGKKPFQVSIPIEAGVIEEFGQEFGEVPEVGNVFRELAGMLANLQIEEEGTTVEMEPQIYDFPELDAVDFDVITELNLRSVRLKITEAETRRDASLKFIKTLKVYLKFDEDSEEKGELLLSYSKEEDPNALGCLERCLDVHVANLNWIEILKNNRTFVLIPEVIVDSVPETEMVIGGEVGVDVMFNLGF